MFTEISFLLAIKFIRTSGIINSSITPSIHRSTSHTIAKKTLDRAAHQTNQYGMRRSVHTIVLLTCIAVARAICNSSTPICLTNSKRLKSSRDQQSIAPHSTFNSMNWYGDISAFSLSLSSIPTTKSQSRSTYEPRAGHLHPVMMIQPKSTIRTSLCQTS
jgi:hypothetical protein